MEIEIRTAKERDYADIAGLIMSANLSADTQCIHSGTAESIQSLVDEITKYSLDGELIYVIAVDEELPVGCFGCEFQKTGHRGWMRGPIGVYKPELIFESMFRLLMENIPQNVNQLDSFLNEQNVTGRSFYEKMGFQLMGYWHVYLARCSSLVEAPVIDPQYIVKPLGGALFDRFCDLHDHIYPDTSYSGKEILGLLDGDHRVWVAVLDQDVVGYVYAVIEPWADEGYVEYIGVHENFRGYGIGACLLYSALNWFFNEREMLQGSLTVSDKNTNARSLYERVGFTLEYTGVNHQLVR
jgi:GNAT superfamily N-acetyltransferase